MNFIRESIFASALRAFSSAFLGILGALLGFGVFFTLMSITVLPSKDTPPPRHVFYNQPRADGTLSNKISDPTFLRINIDGTIGTAGCNTETLNSLIIQIDQMIPPGQLKGILVYLNTPGGSAIDSYNMYMSIKELKQKLKIPVYGFVDGMCASGGVFISSACDKMFSTPPSILGSVGVRMGPYFNFTTLLKNYGVDSLNISTKNKIHLDPFTPWTPNEQDFFKPVLDGLYNQFVDAVVDGRTPDGMTKEQYRSKLLDIGANIYMSQDAVQYGFTNDPNATLSIALKALTEAAGIQDMNYRFVMASYVAPFNLGGVQSMLTKGKIVHEHRLAGDNVQEIQNDRFLAIYP
ncbi:MAG: S49 family peptidase [Chlamydiae bacterium]|nr:S49 family peptidase [Chlamydiota bacterium]